MVEDSSLTLSLPKEAISIATSCVEVVLLIEAACAISLTFSSKEGGL